MASSYSQRASPHVGHIDTTLGGEKKKKAPPPLHLHQNPGHHQLDSFVWRQFATTCWGSCLPGILSPFPPWCVSTASNTHARTPRSGREPPHTTAAQHSKAKQSKAQQSKAKQSTAQQSKAKHSTAQPNPHNARYAHTTLFLAGQGGRI